MSPDRIAPAGGLIAAIYARKSNDQNLPDAEKSATRQVEHGQPSPCARVGPSIRRMSTRTTASPAASF